MRRAALPILLLVLASGLAQAHDYWLDTQGDAYILHRGHRH